MVQPAVAAVAEKMSAAAAGAVAAADAAGPAHAAAAAVEACHGPDPKRRLRLTCSLRL